MSRDELRKRRDADRTAIERRARVIYGRKDRVLPYVNAPWKLREEMERRAALELWDENALNFQPEGSEAE